MAELPNTALGRAPENPSPAFDSAPPGSQSPWRLAAGRAFGFLVAASFSRGLRRVVCVSYPGRAVHVVWQV